MGRGCLICIAFVCSLGMLAGLWIDSLAGRLVTLSALCTSGDRDLLYWMLMHYKQLPAMHMGMLVATLLTVPLHQQTGRGLTGAFSLLLHAGICLGLMWLGMTAGALAIHRAEDGALSVAATLGGMEAGMLLGLQFGIVGAGRLRRLL